MQSVKLTRIAGFAASVALIAGAASADGKRQLDAHVHGESLLNIAVEGGEVQMELEAPGFDIVGFEYEATTDEDKAKIDAALASLRDPQALFSFVGGGCSVAAAEAALLSDDDDHGHDDHGHDDHGHEDHGHEDHGHDEHGHDDHGHSETADAHDHDKHGHDDHGHGEHAHGEEAAEARHSEFQASYRLTCESLDAATALDASGFFERFGTAEVLEATVISDQGARVFDLNAEASSAVLDGGV